MEFQRRHGEGFPLGRGFLQVRTMRLRIAGRVQGVGYREAMVREAGRLGVTGWVRNRADGSVEALIQGHAGALEALLAWAGRGPSGARVERVDSAAPPAGLVRDYARFERWPSV